MNRRGFKYVVTEDQDGKEIIKIYNPELITNKKSEDTKTEIYHPEKEKEVEQLQNPNNF
ncbi:hypothetical protein KSB07_07575 [Acinetobacter junii]|nr:hypothetical protein [Acinetobacter junii]MCE6004199.1 hypothetical protein [Acinetobacter junii]